MFSAARFGKFEAAREKDSVIKNKSKRVDAFKAQPTPLDSLRFNKSPERLDEAGEPPQVITHYVIKLRRVDGGVVSRSRGKCVCVCVVLQHPVGDRLPQIR